MHRYLTIINTSSIHPYHCPLTTITTSLQIASSPRNQGAHKEASNGDRVGKVWVLRPEGGLHPGLHCQRQSKLPRPMAVWAVLWGSPGWGVQKEGSARRGGGSEGSHGVLQDVQVKPRCPGGWRNAADAPEAVRWHVEARISQEVQHLAGWRWIIGDTVLKSSSILRLVDHLVLFSGWNPFHLLSVWCMFSSCHLGMYIRFMRIDASTVWLFYEVAFCSQHNHWVDNICLDILTRFCLEPNKRRGIG